MTKRIQVRVAEALKQPLSMFHAMSGDLLRTVLVETDLNRVMFGFDRCEVAVCANPDDDSVEIRFAKKGEFESSQAVSVGHLDPWAPFIGKPFGWGWITVNQQGYCDGLLVSFGGIDPQLLLTVMASALVVSTVKRREFLKSR